MVTLPALVPADKSLRPINVPEVSLWRIHLADTTLIP